MRARGRPLPQARPTMTASAPARAPAGEPPKDLSLGIKSPVADKLMKALKRPMPQSERTAIVGHLAYIVGLSAYCVSVRAAVAAATAAARCTSPDDIAALAGHAVASLAGVGRELLRHPVPLAAATPHALAHRTPAAAAEARCCTRPYLTHPPTRRRLGDRCSFA